MKAATLITGACNANPVLSLLDLARTDARFSLLGCLLRSRSTSRERCPISRRFDGGVLATLFLSYPFTAFRPDMTLKGGFPCENASVIRFPALIRGNLRRGNRRDPDTPLQIGVFYPPGERTSYLVRPIQSRSFRLSASEMNSNNPQLLTLWL